ncbi:hypothetical protein QP518_05685 [Peptoniphilus harei]|uniref:hypothetical protein n=1 Tax=Peptoniphilus TaxID=162289 RepID=UPI00255045EC|nr:hypothetical protein [Peptoniphilus harei]MDK7355239.1 hypothetical protein [Peptoniphilus harei]MDK7370868.1 hypothetical protein [Peptoniphilus harei]
MKCLTKNLIILFALLFLSLVFLGRTVYRSYTEDPKVHKQEEVNLNQDKGNKNFEILEVPSEKKKQMEESLGYEIAEVKHIRFLDKADYTEEEVNSKEGYTIENISEVKDAIEFSGRDLYQSICKNEKEEDAEIKIGERILRNDYMADLLMDPKIISNALGFDVEKKIKVNLDIEVKVEGKTFASLSLFPEINHYDFEVHKNGRETSKGTAKKVVGGYLIVRKEKTNES